MSVKFLMIYVVILLLGIGISLFVRKIGKEKAIKGEEAFLQRYPDAVKVYTRRHSGFLVSSTLNIYTVNGEEPATFSDEEGDGFYCKVGQNILEVEHSTTRPGIIYRSVTKSTGATKVEVEIKARELYFFYYDKEAKDFRIDLK